MALSFSLPPGDRTSDLLALPRLQQSLVRKRSRPVDDDLASSSLAFHSQYAVNEDLEVWVEDEPLALPCPPHEPFASIGLVDRAPAREFARVGRDLLDDSLVDSGVQRAIEVLSMAVRPDMEEGSPQSEYLDLVCGGR